MSLLKYFEDFRNVRDTDKSGSQLIDPIILQISNNSPLAVANFDVFSAQHLKEGFGGDSWSPEGSLTLQGITISSLFASSSYRQILSLAQNTPFKAGSVYLESINGPKDQVSDVYRLDFESTEGKICSTWIKPNKDSNQFAENGIAYSTVDFNMGPLTKLTWKTIYPLAVFQISIFPAHIINPSLALYSNNVHTHSTRPNVFSNLRVVN